VVFLGFFVNLFAFFVFFLEFFEVFCSNFENFIHSFWKNFFCELLQGFLNFLQVFCGIFEGFLWFFKVFFSCFKGILQHFLDSFRVFGEICFVNICRFFLVFLQVFGELFFKDEGVNMLNRLGQFLISRLNNYYFQNKIGPLWHGHKSFYNVIKLIKNKIRCVLALKVFPPYFDHWRWQSGCYSR
jgi:hypothetical protein